MRTRRHLTFHLPLPRLPLAMLVLPIMLAAAQGSAQTFTVLHTFTGGRMADCRWPGSRLVVQKPSTERLLQVECTITAWCSS